MLATKEDSSKVMKHPGIQESCLNRWSWLVFCFVNLMGASYLERTSVEKTIL